MAELFAKISFCILSCLICVCTVCQLPFGVSRLKWANGDPQLQYLNNPIFNDRFYLSFFIAMHGFRESGFDLYWSLYLSTQKCRPCVYISTPLRYQQKVVRLVLDPKFKSSYEPEKTRFNTCANNKGADQSAHPHRLISAFVFRCSSFCCLLFPRRSFT